MPENSKIVTLGGARLGLALAAYGHPQPSGERRNGKKAPFLHLNRRLKNGVFETRGMAIIRKATFDVDGGRAPMREPRCRQLDTL